ncbi:MAG TPA: glycosyltransferase [Polyangiales bacterium]|nr:glycosyltransferase [Polyangiales bacterium]
MQLAVFGLSVSSSWGNGHATLWRGLIHGLARLGHRVIFFERDTPYYASHRDCHGLPNGELALYADWESVRATARQALHGADAAIVTSYCPDGAAATELVLESSTPIKAFYDLDTPITLQRLAHGEPVPYLTAEGLRDFDVVLSYTGGPALDALASMLAAQRVVPLYGSVDPNLHRPTVAVDRYRADLAYLGTYATERQAALSELFLRPALALPEHKFVLGGSQYPVDFAWSSNIYYQWHVPPYEHAAFFCSARLNLNVTRAPMAAMGYCPSGRLFEAAACRAPLISDLWPGLDEFYVPRSEILVAERAEDVLDALSLSDRELTAIAERAYERTQAEHTIEQRAKQLVEILDNARNTTRGSWNRAEA